jgi:hypothetical protein
MPEKKDEKKPLDMTTDEAIDFLFGKEGAKTLKEYVREQVNPPPEDENKSVDASAKSSRKHTSR